MILNSPMPEKLKPCHLIPTPQKMQLRNKWLRLNTFFLETADRISPAVIMRYRNELPLAETGNPFRLVMVPELPVESYRLSGTDAVIEVHAGDERGFLYALQTLKQLCVGSWLQEGDIEDFPALPLRGFHCNIATMPQIDFPAFMNLLRMLAKFKYNLLLLEYNERFPSQRCPEMVADNAFTSEQIKEVHDFCQLNNIEIMPLVQSLGHMRHLLRLHPDAPYNEDPTGQHASQQLCPLHSDSFKLFTELASELFEAYPEGRYFHIGGDETRSLGHCPRCAEYVKQHGISRLYADYMNKICEWVISRGRRPVIWDDMLARHPETLKLIDKRVIIMYWDYWSGGKKSPYVVARPAGRGIVCDQRWLTEWRGELEENERNIVDRFALKLNLPEDLNQCFTDTLGHCLGQETPKYFQSFPYMQFYREHGFDVIGAPTTLGNGMDIIYGLPNYYRFHRNISGMVARCREYGALGIVTTSWADFPPEILNTGVIYTAQFSWNSGEE